MFKLINAMKKRKANRLKGYDYSKNNIYFVTNCVKNNVCCLGSVVPVGIGGEMSVQNLENRISDLEYDTELNQYGRLVDEKINWLINQYPYIDIHNYKIMPNHFHLIIEIDSTKVSVAKTKIKSLSSLMGALKTTASKAIHNEGLETFAWHRSFHDHIIRNEKTYNKIFNYINSNPDRWAADKFYKSV